MTADIDLIDWDEEFRRAQAEEERIDRIDQEFEAERERFWDEYGDAERLWRE